MLNKSIEKIFALAVAAMLASVMHAQNISEIAKSDPLIITGAVGTQNTYRYSSAGNGFSSPMSNTVFANLNISVGYNQVADSFRYVYQGLLRQDLVSLTLSIPLVDWGVRKGR